MTREGLIDRTMPPRFRKLPALLLGLAVAGCAPDSGDGTAQGGREAATTMFEVWERAREAVRASPDHLPARAEALVSEGDPEKIFAFVRDEIATYPPTPGGFGRYDAVSGVRWGTRGTLRGGAGTPREKVELLVELLHRAGFDARVVQGAPDETVDPREVLLHRPVRRFAPAADAAQLGAWRKVLGYDAAPSIEPIDPDLAATRRLAERIMDTLPRDAARVSAFDFDSVGRLPLAKMTVDGQTRYANPLVPGAELGKSYTREDPLPTGSADRTPAVWLRLEAATTEAPFDRFTLLEGRWRAGELVGRRVELGFAPPVSTEELTGLRASDVETVIPVARVYGPGLDAGTAAGLSVVGLPVSLQGDRFAIEGERVHIDGEAFASPTSARAQASVTRIGMEADAATWPRIELRVKALDADGQPVSGLGIDAFRIADGGQPRSAVMTRNRSRAPHVLFLLDRSNSVPEAFRGGAMAAIAERIARRLLEQIPNARFRVGTISYGVSYEGRWTSSMDELEAQLADQGVGDSDFWKALAEVARDGPTATILVTDAKQDPEGPPTPAQREAIAGGPPVVALGVGEYVQETLDTMAALSGGVGAVAADHAQAVAAAAQFLDTQRTVSYELTYRAPAASDPGDARRVRVAFDGGRLEAVGAYVVPRRPARPKRLSGLYLTLGVGNARLTRTLAGYDGAFTAHPDIGDAVLDAVEGMLFGRVSIRVEAAGPPWAVRLDDWLSAKLKIQPLWDAAAGGDAAALIQALESGVSLPPSEPLLLAGAVPWNDKDAATFETGPQLVTVVERPVFGRGRVRTVDLFPFSGRRTLAEDGAAAWQRNLARSAYLAVFEDALLGDGTYSRLQGEALMAVDRRTREQRLEILPRARRYRWEHLLDPYEVGNRYTMVMPRDGDPEAFWVVHKATGRLTGIMPDGTGGARQEIEAEQKRTERFIALAGRLGSLIGGPAVGVWATLEKTKARLVARATITLATGVVPDNLDKIAKDTACDLAKAGLGSKVPALGRVFNWEGDIGIAGGYAGVGTPSIPCPL